MGDAGAVTTADPKLARRMAMFARHGGLRKGDHQIEGVNSRLDGLQAAILSVKLRHLPKWTRARQSKAAVYDSMLVRAKGLSTPQRLDGMEHVYHTYTVRHERRDELKSMLSEHCIQTGINYPVALPFLPAYKRLGHVSADFPNAWRNQSRILSLPLYPELAPEQQSRVAQAVIQACEQLS